MRLGFYIICAFLKIVRNLCLKLLIRSVFRSDGCVGARQRKSKESEAKQEEQKSSNGKRDTSQK